MAYSALARCNLGRLYVPRKDLLESVKSWLFSPDEPPYLFLVGQSGIGKTNFLVQFIEQYGILGQDRDPRAVLMFALGQYNLERARERDHVHHAFRDAVQNHQDLSLLDNLIALVKEHASLSLLAEGGTLERLIGNGDIFLVLDGLDEFARNHGDEKCQRLFQDLQHYFMAGRPKVGISCRDHTYRRLVQRPWFPKHGSVYTEVTVPFLTLESVTAALEMRVGNRSACYAAVTGNHKLLGFARNPLLLEIMCRIPRETWKTLRNVRAPARLYDAWFQEVIAAGTDPINQLDDEAIGETRIKVGRIARLMLESRSDLISEEALAEGNLTNDRLSTLTRSPFGILIKETKDEWGFVHASFREFALAHTAAAEFASRKYDLLAKTTSFDYVGAETYWFLKDLIPTDEQLFSHLDEALRARVTMQNEMEWNNIARNTFEAVGMIGGTSAERFIDIAVDILNTATGGRDQGEGRVSYATQWNIVRCLERLHPTAPPCYCEHMMTVVWPKTPDFKWFGAVAIRGFHMRSPRPGYFPPMEFLARNTGASTEQEKVSDCLLAVLESLQSQTDDDGAKYLEINCTHALIRWLHDDHLGRVEALLDRSNLSCDSRGNFFQAFLRFGKPEIFYRRSQLFAYMTLWWCYITRSMVSEDWVFRSVTFRKRQESRIEGFTDDEFENCLDDLDATSSLRAADATS